MTSSFSLVTFNVKAGDRWQPCVLDIKYDKTSLLLASHLKPRRFLYNESGDAIKKLSLKVNVQLEAGKYVSEVDTRPQILNVASPAAFEGAKAAVVNTVNVKPKAKRVDVTLFYFKLKASLTLAADSKANRANSY